jgi:diphosphomevalonate decarboxylase
VELPAGEPGNDALSARPIAPPEHWDLRVVVAVTAEGRKAVGSRDAMGETRASSPYYAAWVHASRGLAARVGHALLARDMTSLAPLIEQSFFAMHAVAMCASPSILYWQPGSVAALRTIRALRDAGMPVGATMDAGPHVKAVCIESDAKRVEAALADTPGVIRTLVTRPGPAVEVDTVEP